MTDYFVDSTTGDNGDNGTTFDLAWATVEYALETADLSAGDIVHVRPVHSEIPTSDIALIDRGTADNPIQIIGWSRAALPDTTITAADFTKGSKIIDNVTGITPARVAHINRYITAPDGKQYHITAVIWEAGLDGIGAGDGFAVGEILTNTTQTKKGKVWAAAETESTDTIQYVRDSATAWVDNDNLISSGGGDGEIDASGETAVGFILSQEYAGSTVTGTDGKFQIDADPDYSTDQAIDDSTWTIKKADWDAQDLPTIDFNDGNYQIKFFTDYYFSFKNIEFKDSADSSGILYGDVVKAIKLEGCLFKQTAANCIILNIGSSTYGFLKRVICEGSGSGTSQVGLYIRLGKLVDVVVNNAGDFGLQVSGVLKIQRVNVGIEMANSDDDICTDRSSQLTGADLAIGGTNGTYSVSNSAYICPFYKVHIENYQKVFDDHFIDFRGGTSKNVDVGDSNAPSAASPAGSITDLIAVYPNSSGYEYIEEWLMPLATWKIWAAAAAETYTVYIQNNMGVTLNDTAAKDDIWLKLTYIDFYDDTTKYRKKELFSTEIDILDRADATDWDSLTIANHTPAKAGWAVLELFVSKYVASGQIYIDGKYV